MKNSSCPESSGAKNLQQRFRIIKRHSVIKNWRCEKDLDNPVLSKWYKSSGDLRGWERAGIVQAQLPEGIQAGPSQPHGKEQSQSLALVKIRLVLLGAGNNGLFIVWRASRAQNSCADRGVLCVSFNGNKSILK